MRSVIFAFVIFAVCDKYVKDSILCVLVFSSYVICLVGVLLVVCRRFWNNKVYESRSALCI